MLTIKTAERRHFVTDFAGFNFAYCKFSDLLRKLNFVDGDLNVKYSYQFFYLFFLYEFQINILYEAVTFTVIRGYIPHG